MTESDTSQPEAPVHHETLEEAAAEGVIPGIEAEDRDEEAGLDLSATADPGEGDGEVQLGNRAWPGE